MKLIGRKTSVGAVVAAALMLPCMGMIAPASAHHAFAAEYDAKKHVILKGTVTSIWIHAWGLIHSIFVTVPFKTNGLFTSNSAAKA